ncbi:MAG: hypothetical protein Q8R25_04325 [bacterium]|nr:hypothetical protein [bacterium]
MKTIEGVVVVGDVQVLRNLFYPQVIGKNGLPVVRALIAPGGAKSGRTMAERFRAFESAGIVADHFDKALATSSGSYNTVAYCAGQTHITPDVYEKMSWLNPEVLQSAWTKRDYLGLEYLRAELINMLDLDAFYKNKTDLMIGVADMKANVKLFNAKDPNINVFDLMYASSALFPFVQPVKIAGERYVDGGYTRQSSVLQWARKILRDTPLEQEINMLYVANRPHPLHHQHPWEDWIFNGIVDTFLTPYYPELGEGAKSIGDKVAKAADAFGRPHKRGRACAIFGLKDENIRPNEWRVRTLRTCGALTHKRTEACLKALKPTIWV